jgi:transposase
MRQLTEILRLKFELRLSHARIAGALGVSKGVVSKYLSLAHTKGIGWPLPPDLDPGALERLLFPVEAKPGRLPDPDFLWIHHELKRKGVTLQLLWSEYVEAHHGEALRYSQFCRRYRDWRATQRRSMRQQHLAGEKLFIDYCGPTVPVVSPATGEITQAQIFVAVWGASSYTFAEATRTQSLPDWIGSHVRALEFFGGAPTLFVPDNLKSAVTRACRYDPQLNRSYAEMARHYGVAILPARPLKPKDKAKAEAGVLLVERWILARLRHQHFHSFAELNRAIADLLVELNERPFQRQPHSRRDLFLRLDRPAMQSLPEQRYEFAEWKFVRPGIDYHVEIDRRFYSVPHALVGQRLEARYTATSVELFHRHQRVAVHPRQGVDRFSTLPEHMPQSHRAHREWSPSRFLRWAGEIGPETRAVVQGQLENRPHPEHGYRACLGLLKLARRFDPARLEAACRRARRIGSPNYTSIKSILDRGLDRLGDGDDATASRPLPLHENVRGADYYH